MEYASTIDVGTRKRRHHGINEDAIATAVFENHHRQSSRTVGVFVLCDGVGGEASGDVASFLATTIIRKSLVDALLGPKTDVPERFEIDAIEGPAPTDGTDTGDDGHDEPLTEAWIQQAIREAINAAHRRIQKYADEIDGRPATTAVVAIHVDDHLHYGWVGDSRAYVINAEHRQIQQLTRDHAVTNRLLDRGEIEDDVFARVHEDTTAITNALGGSAYGKPDVDVDFGSVPLFKEDIVLLTSDGLIDAFPDISPLREHYRKATDKEAAREALLDVLVTDDEIRHTILDADDLRDGVETLVTLANDRGGKDNLSILLVRDPEGDPTPRTLPKRGVRGTEEPSHSPDGHKTVDKPADSLVNRETIIESSSPPDRAESADDDHSQKATGSVGTTEENDSIDQPATEAGSEDSRSSVSSTSSSGRDTDQRDEREGEDEPTATIVIEGQDNIYEIAPGFTIGRGEVGAADNPDIGLVVTEEASIETHHARFECDEARGWLVRDISTSGTFVRDGDQWQYLLSADGVDVSRERGFDPEADPAGIPDETCRLDDGVAITLHHPQDRRAITLRFYSSLDSAREALRSETDEGDFFRRGRS